MLRKVLLSKIHRATVTHCDLDYVGSITIDADLLRATGLRPNECVMISDCENGARFETYIFEGEAGSGVIGVNGAAAHLTAVGHKIIIMGYAQMTEAEMEGHASVSIVVDEQNRVAQRLTYPCKLGQGEPV